jgi:hypothetical protein
MKVGDLMERLALLDGNAEVTVAVSGLVSIPVARAEFVSAVRPEHYEHPVPRREWLLAQSDDDRAERIVVLKPDPDALEAQERPKGFGWDREWLHQKYWDEGWTQKDIADHIGTRASTVSRAMDRLGIPTRGRGAYRIDLDCAMLRNLYVKQGKTLREMGERLGLSFEKVRGDMDRCGIPRRSPGGRDGTDE